MQFSALFFVHCFFASLSVIAGKTVNSSQFISKKINKIKKGIETYQKYEQT